MVQPCRALLAVSLADTSSWLPAFMSSRWTIHTLCAESFQMCFFFRIKTIIAALQTINLAVNSYEKFIAMVVFQKLTIVHQKEVQLNI